jgi:hypothetical protein
MTAYEIDEETLKETDELLLIGYVFLDLLKSLSSVFDIPSTSEVAFQESR